MIFIVCFRPAVDNDVRFMTFIHSPLVCLCSLCGILIWELGVLFQEYTLKAYP